MFLVSSLPPSPSCTLCAIVIKKSGSDNPPKYLVLSKYWDNPLKYVLFSKYLVNTRCFVGLSE